MATETAGIVRPINAVARTMTPQEIIQLATLLAAQAEPLLRPYKPDSPDLLGHVLSSLSELPGLLEVAFDEVDCLDELARESERAQKIIDFRFRLGV